MSGDKAAPQLGTCEYRYHFGNSHLFTKGYCKNWKPVADPAPAAPKEYKVSRFHDGKRMAEGARVTASCEDEALDKARRLFYPLKDGETFEIDAAVEAQGERCPNCPHPKHSGVCSAQIMEGVFCYCGVSAPGERCPNCQSPQRDKRYEVAVEWSACGHSWHNAPATAASSEERCAHCDQKIGWQCRTPDESTCAQGYWFSNATGSGCPKSKHGHERILKANAGHPSQEGPQLSVYEAHWTNESIEALVFRTASDFIAQIEHCWEDRGIKRTAPEADKLGIKEAVELAKSLGLKVGVLAYDDGDHNNLKGPIISDVFVKCWEKLGKPEDMFDLQQERQVMPNERIPPSSDVTGADRAVNESGVGGRMEKSVTPENVVDSDLCECGKPFWDYVHNLPEGRDDFNNHEFRPAGVGGREESPWREIACEIAGRHIIIRVEDIEQAIALAVEKSAIWYSGYPPSKHAVETIREFMLAELLEQKENESRVGRTVVPEESARQTMERNGQKSPKTLR